MIQDVGFHTILIILHMNVEKKSPVNHKPKPKRNHNRHNNRCKNTNHN